MSDIADTRENINDGKLDFDTHVALNTDALEAFFRSMLKPVNDNETDIDKKNIIVKENFSFEPLKRLYFQDLYKSLLANEKLYHLISVTPFNNTFPQPNPTMEVVSNSVTIQGNTGNDPLNEQINGTVGGNALGPVEIANSFFHSTIEFTDNGNNRVEGLYDPAKLKTANSNGDLFSGLGLLEQVFDDEEKLLKEDIKRENGIISLQTLARRMVELFARLSNIRLSMLFWTDKVNDYSKEWMTGALDIFYNLLSRMSEAHRINIPREYAGVRSDTVYEPQQVTVRIADDRPLNVLLWVDASSSMVGSGAIGKLKEKIKELIDYVQKINAECKIGICCGNSGTGHWSARSGFKPLLCCNFTNKTNLLKQAINLIPTKSNGNECDAGIIDVLTNNVDYPSSCKYIWTDAHGNGKLKWDEKTSTSKGAKRIVIVFSDEPMDNYTSMCSMPERKHHYNSDYDKAEDEYNWNGGTNRFRKKVPRWDNTTYTYYCLPKKNGNWQTYNAQTVNGQGSDWVVVADWQFNNSWNHRTHNDAGDKPTVWHNRVPSVGGEFTKKQFIDAFINPGLDVDHPGNITQAKIDIAQEKVAELHWVFVDAGTGDASAVNAFKSLITSDFLVPISKANEGNGASITSVKPSDDLTKSLKNIFAKRCNYREVTITQMVPVTVTTVDETLDGITLKYARAARLNKTYADMMRPCVFVPNLVSTMMMIVQSRKNPNGKTGSDGWPAWSELLNKVKDKNGNKYTWFARSNLVDSCLFEGGDNSLYKSWPQKIEDFSEKQRQQNEALRKGGDYAESFTGIHLKLLGNDVDIDRCLEEGLGILADTFDECFKDAEVMKCLDMSGSKPTPTNLWKLMHDNPSSLANVGDLQYALILERIIAKIYSELNVKGCSYFSAKNPKLNLDFALRFLTDETFSNNELGELNSKYRLAYSNVRDYIDRIVRDTTATGSQVYEDFDKDSKNILEHVVGNVERNSAHSVTNVSVNQSFKYMLEDWSLCPYRFSNPHGFTSQPEVVEQNVGSNLDNYKVEYFANPTKKVCPFAGLEGEYFPVVTFGKGSKIWNGSSSIVKEWVKDLTLDFIDSEPDEDGVRKIVVDGDRYELKRGEDASHWNLDLFMSGDQGPTLSFNIILSQPDNPIVLTTTDLTFQQNGVFVDSNPHGCKLQYSYLVDQILAMEDDLKSIPPICPCRSLASKLLQRIDISKKLPVPTESESRGYIHALFKEVKKKQDSEETFLDDTKNEEHRSMGYEGSDGILNHPDDTENPPPPTYKEEEHSNVRLVYLDQLIRLCKDLFRFNMYLAFDEPYLKTKVIKAKQHYYGDETHGSFEPLTCYRFSNFHARNEQDSRSSALATPQYKMKVYARSLNEQHVTAINRDLSGETTFTENDTNPGGIWKRDTTLILDNDRKVPTDDGTGLTSNLESQNAYPEFFGYTPAADTGKSEDSQGHVTDSNAFMATNEEIECGIIDPNKSRNKDICRKSTSEGHRLYSIHLMDELKTEVNNQEIVREENKTTSLTTLEVWVKRFRPIFLPNAQDLFKSDDRDPYDPTNNDKSAPVLGWAITPHKYTADVHFSKDAIIIPMNMTSRNSPRSGWFNELDYDFHVAKVQGKTSSSNGVALSGFYDESRDAKTTAKIAGKEWEDLCKYHYRDWMYPVAMLDHLHVSGEAGALATISDVAKTRMNTDAHPKDGANDYVQGTDNTGDIEIYKKDDSHRLVVTKENLRYLDLLKCIDSNVDQSTALCANWLYITVRAEGEGIETSQCLFPLPWVFFHSSRGGAGECPNYYHGLGGRATQDHETGFRDDDPDGMRFFAVDAVLAQNPVKMKLFGRDDQELDAYASAFYKGFYDPSCAGKTTKWSTHGNAYYGWDNGFLNKGGPRPDKYMNPYSISSSGRISHVLVGNSLTSSSTPNGPFDNVDNPALDKNLIIRSTLVGKPMTWSLWNILRQSIYYTYMVEDVDYDPNRENCIIDRKTIGITNEEVEIKTARSMREMYREWYKRFTSGGRYCSKAGIGDGKGTAWPYKKTDEDPANYWEAQRLLKGASESIEGKTCHIEWTNLVADVDIIYNEVSDTHDSCMTIYTGSHPQYSVQHTDSADGEFRGKQKDGDGYKESPASGVASDSIPTSWAGTTRFPNESNSKPFRYTCDGVDMCRNFMALTYRGYNSSIPSRAWSGSTTKFQPHSTHPKDLQVSREIRTVKWNGNVIDRETASTDGTEMNANDVYLRDIYPPTEYNDTEGCDMNYLQRLLIPCYPNWEDLHDSAGTPLHPDAVTDDDYKKIIFCVAPQTYYDGHGCGNEGDGTQLNERMMAFCIAQFYTGEEAEKMTSTLDTEFFEKVRQPNVSVIADDLGHDYKPGDPPWGEALVAAGNWDPSHWNIQS